MSVEEVHGIILFKREYRERDFLVKILTAEYGPIMFFVRGQKRERGAIFQSIQPMTKAIYIADIRHQGLSFIQGAKEVNHLIHLRSDIKANAYAAHVLALANAATTEFEQNLQIFQGLSSTLNLMNQGLDSEALSLIFEVKALRHFGVMPELRGCVICGKIQGAFDYSPRHHGLICPEHFHLDSHRLHAMPRAIHLIRQFSMLEVDKLSSVNLKKETKEAIRYVVDLLYDDLVGIHLKTKKFINQMDQWEDDLQNKISKIKSERDN